MDVLSDRILVSRESARLLEEALRRAGENVADSADAAGHAPITVDFHGVEGIAPSFLDELLSIFESLFEAGRHGGHRGLIVANPPTRLSLKFQAIARGHGMSVQRCPDGSWRLEDHGSNGSR